MRLPLFLYLWRFAFCPNMQSVLEKVSWVTEKNVFCGVWVGFSVDMLDPFHLWYCLTPHMFFYCFVLLCFIYFGGAVICLLVRVRYWNHCCWEAPPSPTPPISDPTPEKACCQQLLLWNCSRLFKTGACRPAVCPYGLSPAFLRVARECSALHCPVY